ncbi:hypothetical protein HanPSC8_Chr17g0774651 [Helianthus annuus]|nr:hypothetical protein HanPSC8_Chr17g0774651 [Helianthus annuus]
MWWCFAGKHFNSSSPLFSFRSVKIFLLWPLWLTFQVKEVVVLRQNDGDKAGGGDVGSSLVQVSRGSSFGSVVARLWSSLVRVISDLTQVNFFSAPVTCGCFGLV